MKNVSSNGSCVEFEASRELGCVVLVTEPSAPLDVYAEVVWEGEGKSGHQFLHERK